MDKQVILLRDKSLPPPALVFLLFLFCAALLVGCREQEADEGWKKNGKTQHVTAAPKGLNDAGNMQVGVMDNCSICGMPVHKHLKFATAIELEDGAVFYFCGTQCLIRAWLQPDIFLGTPKENLKRSIVTSYFSGEHLDGRNAFFVMGSDVMGPMGPGLIALADERERDAFTGRHGGSSLRGIEAVSRAILEEASGRKFGGK